MSFELVGDVMAARRAPWKNGKFIVLLVLASYANDDGTSIHPSVDRLARACRMTVRGVQECLAWLRRDGVLKLEQEAFGHRTNLYAIDIARVALFMGCKKCGGAICSDKGCKKQREGVQKSARSIDTLSRPHLTQRRGTPRPVDRRGDPALWSALVSKIEPAVLTKLETWGATPSIDGDRVVVDFERAFAERYVRSERARVQAALGRETVFRYAGREGQP